MIVTRLITYAIDTQGGITTQPPDERLESISFCCFRLASALIVDYITFKAAIKMPYCPYCGLKTTFEYKEERISGYHV